MTFAAPFRTSRLTLVPATAALVAAEIEGREAFAAGLGAVVPASWPPGEYDAAAQQYFLARLLAVGTVGVGWYGWYAVRDADSAAPATVVAAGGFHGPPSPDGVVELGYSVCPEWRGRGHAVELVAALAAHAAGQPGVRRVIARTTAANPASVRVLERSCFRAVDGEAEPGSLCFEYRPEVT